MPPETLTDDSPLVRNKHDSDKISALAKKPSEKSSTTCSKRKSRQKNTWQLDVQRKNP